MKTWLICIDSTVACLKDGVYIINISADSFRNLLNLGELLKLGQLRQLRRQSQWRLEPLGLQCQGLLGCAAEACQCQLRHVRCNNRAPCVELELLESSPRALHRCAPQRLQCQLDGVQCLLGGLHHIEWMLSGNAHYHPFDTHFHLNLSAHLLRQQVCPSPGGIAERFQRGIQVAKLGLERDSV